MSDLLLAATLMQAINGPDFWPLPDLSIASASLPDRPTPDPLLETTVQPETLPILTEFSQGVRPASGSQLYQQRLMALRAGKLYTRLPSSSYQSAWRRTTRRPSYEDWKRLLRQEARAAARGQGTNRMSVLVGDSLSMWFPTQRLSNRQLWLNQGISGDTTSGILQRLSAFGQTRPDAVYVLAGINDLKRGAADGEVLGNLRQIMRKLRQRHPQARIVVQSLLPTREVGISNQRIQRINQRLQEITREEGSLYLDLYSQFSDWDGNLRPELTTDGLHLNPQGYATWQAVLQQADRWLALNPVRS